MSVLYKYSYLQKHSSCANLLLFKNVWIVPFLPVPIYIFKACIKINFGVGKLLYVLSHIVFYVYLYIYKGLSVDRTVQKLHFKIHNVL